MATSIIESLRNSSVPVISIEPSHIDCRPKVESHGHSSIHSFSFFGRLLIGNSSRLREHIRMEEAQDVNKLSFGDGSRVLLPLARPKINIIVGLIDDR